MKTNVVITVHISIFLSTVFSKIFNFFPSSLLNLLEPWIIVVVKSNLSVFYMHFHHSVTALTITRNCIYPVERDIYWNIEKLWSSHYPLYQGNCRDFIPVIEHKTHKIDSLSRYFPSSISALNYELKVSE